MRTTLLFVLTISLFVIPGYSQLDTGTISGRIADSSGAIVPGAQVTVVSALTNFESLTTTNADGLFRVPSLRPGLYRVTVKATGFKTYVHENLDLHVGDTMAVNPTLEVGGVSDSVIVTAETPQLQTETSSGGALLEGAYLQELPIYQRNVKAAFYLLPNVDIQGFGYSGNLQGFHINGLQDSKIGYFQDGTYAVGNNNGTIYTDRKSVV